MKHNNYLKLYAKLIKNTIVENTYIHIFRGKSDSSCMIACISCMKGRFIPNAHYQ